MTKFALFNQLCQITNALQEECARLRFSPHKLALEALQERLDAVIDQVLEEGVERGEEDETHA